MKLSITSSKGMTYHVDQLLCKGQLSKGYRGIDDQKNEHTIKAVNWEKLMISESMVQLFKNEQQIMEMVDNFRILKLYDKLIDGSKIYLITTYCDGGNQGNLIHNNFPNGMGSN